MTELTLFDLAQPAATAPRKPRRTHPAKHLASTSGRGLRATWCRDCQAPILTGLDADTLAITARVDPTPLDALGELVALLASPPRATYTLQRPPGRNARVTVRDRWSIRTRPADTDHRRAHDHYDVVPAHACHQPLPAQPSQLVPAAKETPGDACPY